MEDDTRNEKPQRPKPRFSFVTDVAVEDVECMALPGQSLSVSPAVANTPVTVFAGKESQPECAGRSSLSSSSTAAPTSPPVDEDGFHRHVERLVQDFRVRLSAEHDKVVIGLRSQNQELRRLLSENGIAMPPELPLPDLLPDYLERCGKQGSYIQPMLAANFIAAQPSSPRLDEDGGDKQHEQRDRKISFSSAATPFADRAPQQRKTTTFSALRDDDICGPPKQTLERRQSTQMRRPSQLQARGLKSAKTMPVNQRLGPPPGGCLRGPGGTPVSPGRKRSIFRDDNPLDGMRSTRSASPMPPGYGNSSSSSGPRGARHSITGLGGARTTRRSVSLGVDDLAGLTKSASARPADAAKERAAAESMMGQPLEPVSSRRLSLQHVPPASTVVEPRRKSLALLDKACVRGTPKPSPHASPAPSPRGSACNEIGPEPSGFLAPVKEVFSQPGSARNSEVPLGSVRSSRASGPGTPKAGGAPPSRFSGMSCGSDCSSPSGDDDNENGNGAHKESVVWNAWTCETNIKERNSVESTDVKQIRQGSALLEEDEDEDTDEKEKASFVEMHRETVMERREAFVTCGVLAKMTNDLAVGQKHEDMQDTQPEMNGGGTESAASTLWRRTSCVAPAKPSRQLRFGNGGTAENGRGSDIRKSHDSALSVGSEESRASSEVQSSGLSPSSFSYNQPGNNGHRPSVQMDEGMCEMCEYDDDEFDEEEDDMQHYWLAPIWMEWNDRGKTYTRKAAVSGNQVSQHQLFIMDAEQKEEMACDLLTGASTRAGEKMERFMIHPNQFGRMVWDMLGCVLFCWDAVVIPLQFFNPPKVLLLVLMAWVVRIYWTIDIFVSFLTGHLLLNGNVDIRPEATVKRYLRGWFIFDSVVVCLDWSELVGGFDEFAIARVGKMAKTVRMLRMFRVLKLMRTVKLPEALRNWTYYFQSERLTILVGIFRIMVAIVWVTHFFACFWYGIGRPNGEEIADDTWVDTYGFARADLGYLYTTSFHWSLTQFTGAMEVNPTNTLERIFSIIALLFAFIVSAFAVSSITTSMTRLEIITTQQSTQFAKLRQYLLANGISKMLSLRIQRSANREVEEAKLRASENDVELLQLVSEPLRVELHYELNSPAMMVHPFFYCFDQVYSAAMRQICHTAIDRKTFHRGDMLFSDGECPEDGKMYFLLNGRLLYLQDENNPKTVHPGHWSCEAALWTQWHYHGSMRSITDTHLALLDAGKFQKITCGFITRDANPIHYGKEFLKHLNNTPKVYMTDLIDPLGLDLGELASKVLNVAQPNSIFSKIRALGSSSSNTPIDMSTVNGGGGGFGGFVAKQLSTRSANSLFGGAVRHFGSLNSSTSANTATAGNLPMSPSGNQLKPPPPGGAPPPPRGRRFSLSVLPSQATPALGIKVAEAPSNTNGIRKGSL